MDIVFKCSRLCCLSSLQAILSGFFFAEWRFRWRWTLCNKWQMDFSEGQQEVVEAWRVWCLPSKIGLDYPLPRSSSADERSEPGERAHGPQRAPRGGFYSEHQQHQQPPTNPAERGVYHQDKLCSECLFFEQFCSQRWLIQQPALAQGTE